MFEGKKLRDRLHAGQMCLGTWINFTDPRVAELLCSSGFDFLILDSEHSALGIETIQHNIMATKGSQVSPIVRVAWNDAVLIKQALDMGAAGILVPLIRTAHEARQVLAACLYPPAGERGFGPLRPTHYYRQFGEYIETANDHIVVWIMIEDIEAVNNIEEIVRIPRLDGIFIGQFDLSGSMGLLGQINHPRVDAAIEKIIYAAKAASLPIGITSPPRPEIAFQWLSKGVQFLTLGDDITYLVDASQGVVSGLKNLVEK